MTAAPVQQLRKFSPPGNASPATPTASWQVEPSEGDRYSNGQTIQSKQRVGDDERNHKRKRDRSEDNPVDRIETSPRVRTKSEHEDTGAEKDLSDGAQEVNFSGDRQARREYRLIME